MTQTNSDLIPALRQILDIEFDENITAESLKEKLSLHINHLILSDFNRLVSVLYRIDVSESKLKQLLKENPGEDAAIIIAGLIMERQLQKIKSRKENRRIDKNIRDDEKW